MKITSLLPNALVLVSYVQLKTSFAVEETTLIRRAQHPHEGAPLGEPCHHACDCEGYPIDQYGRKICCDKRWFSGQLHKVCTVCCLPLGAICKEDKDCCSQLCENGVCVHRPHPPGLGYCPILFPGDEYPISTDIPFITYTEPKYTGPLRWVKFCPPTATMLKRPEGEEQVAPKSMQEAAATVVQSSKTPIDDPILMYLIRGQCDHVNDKTETWTILQCGLLNIHWNKNNGCFNIPITYVPQLKDLDYHRIDFTRYHVLFFFYTPATGGFWPLVAPPLVFNEELIMLARCGDRMDYDNGHTHP